MFSEKWYTQISPLICSSNFVGLRHLTTTDFFSFISRRRVASHIDNHMSNIPQRSNLVNLAEAANLHQYVKQKRKRARHLPPPQPARERRSYKRTSDNDRHTVISMYFNQGKTPAEIRVSLDNRITESNIHHIISTFQHENRIDKKHRGGRRAQYSLDEKKILVQLQKEHADWTYKQLREEWHKITHATHKRLSNGTIHNIFDEFGVTTKMLGIEPKSRNTPYNIQQRFDYAVEHMAVEADQCIYIDELGFNLHCHRRRGRAFVGKRALVERSDQRGGNISVCVAMSATRGILKVSSQQAGFTTVNFVNFLRELIHEQLVTRAQTNYFIMDNVPFHRSDAVAEVFRDLNPRQILQFTPSYSPQLNAIEECFAKVVMFISTRRVNSATGMISLIEQGFRQITSENTRGYHNHVIHWMQHCLNRRPLRDQPNAELSNEEKKI